MSYIQFIIGPDISSGITKSWDVCNADGQYKLGNIRWYAPWRRYVFYTLDDRLFDVSCLRDIAEFIEREMKKKKC